jgi:hypothetical protein
MPYEWGDRSEDYAPALNAEIDKFNQWRQSMATA